MKVELMWMQRKCGEKTGQNLNALRLGSSGKPSTSHFRINFWKNEIENFLFVCLFVCLFFARYFHKINKFLASQRGKDTNMYCYFQYNYMIIAFVEEKDMKQ